MEYLQLLATVLSDDFDTIKATGVKDALNILQTITVDAICSDFNMKDGTGLDLLEDIRQQGITIPFLLMSGNDDRLLIQQTNILKLHEQVKSRSSHYCLCCSEL